MTLKQGFTIWACAPRNTVLAAKSREAVQKVLMKKWGDLDLEVITPMMAERIFRESPESQELKVKAASILVYILQWGGDHGHCRRPTFDYTIANVKPKSDAQPVNHGDCPTDSSEAEIEGTVPCDSHRPDKGETSDDADPLAGIDFDDPKEVADALMEQSARIMNDKPNEQTSMSKEKKPRGKAPKPVAQLDPETLKVVKVWPSRCEAERQTGACNIDRCIAKHRMSAGYYWCMPDEADTFKPNPLSGNQPKQAKPKQEVSPSTGDANHRGQSPCSSSSTAHTGDSPHDSRHAAEKSLADYTNDELLAEIKRRGWKGNVTMTVNVEL